MWWCNFDAIAIMAKRRKNTSFLRIFKQYNNNCLLTRYVYTECILYLAMERFGQNNEKKSAVSKTETCKGLSIQFVRLNSTSKRNSVSPSLCSLHFKCNIRRKQESSCVFLTFAQIDSFGSFNKCWTFWIPMQFTVFYLLLLLRFLLTSMPILMANWKAVEIFPWRWILFVHASVWKLSVYAVTERRLLNLTSIVQC